MKDKITCKNCKAKNEMKHKRCQNCGASLKWEPVRKPWLDYNDD